MKDLTEEEADAHREYRRQLRQAWRDDINRKGREYYQKRQATMTEEQKEAQRQKWRKANERKRSK